MSHTIIIFTLLLKWSRNHLTITIFGSHEYFTIKIECKRNEGFEEGTDLQDLKTYDFLAQIA